MSLEGFRRGTLSLAEAFPELAAQLLPSSGFSADEIIRWDEREADWRCPEGHEFRLPVVARARSRSAGKGCPHCDGRRLTPDYNLAALHPDLMEEWSSANTLDPTLLMPGSNLSAHWTCEFGHRWEARISKRAIEGQNCHVCASHYRLFERGVNDLPTTYPELAAEWSPRNPRPASEYSYGSVQDVHWCCSRCGHEWIANPRLRCTAGGGRCPRCYPNNRSRGEDEVRDALETLGQQVRQSVRDQLPGKQELDIYVPELNAAVEFNGVYWHSELHKSDDYHINKAAAAESRGIQLLTVWEDDWCTHMDLVKRLLAESLGVTTGQRVVSATDCALTTLDAQTASAWLETHTLPGAVPADTYRALTSPEGDTVAVLALTGSAVLRYGTACSVPGGLQALTVDLGPLTATVDRSGFEAAPFVRAGWVAQEHLPPRTLYYDPRSGGRVQESALASSLRLAVRDAGQTVYARP